jgi:hypothetical protein
MDALALTVGLALAAAAFGLILYPLWQQTRSAAIFQVDRSGQTLEEYQARYQATLDAIKDLMFDYEMGKVSTEDHDRLLSKAKIEAAQIRHQIDRLSHSVNAGAKAALDVEIERLVAQLRGNSFSENQPLLREVEAEIELIKNIQLDSAEIDEPACPHCGQAFLPNDLFCTGCGQALAEHAAKDSCPACGYAFQADDTFCARCGHALKEEAQVQPDKGVVTG